MAKLLSTKLAKQVSGYHLIKNDLEFSKYVFLKAAVLPTLKETEPKTKFDKNKTIIAVNQAVEKAYTDKNTFVRDQENTDNNQFERDGLFEAGIIAYARCFNSGHRTALTHKIFKNKLFERKKIHNFIIKLRNKHIAHSELKLERSYVGVSLVNDPKFGNRPSVVCTLFSVRRPAPSSEKLREMAAHCEAIIDQYLEPQIIKVGSKMREQLIGMPQDQIDRLPDFNKQLQSIDLPKDIG